MQNISMDIWGLFVSSFVSATIAPGGSEAVLAYLVSENNQKMEFLVLVATIGNTLGALTTWGLGAVAATKYPLEKMLSEKKQNSLKFVKKWGSWAMLFSWLPVVGDGLCFAGGWLRFSLFYSFVAIIVGKAFRYYLVASFFI